VSFRHELTKGLLRQNPLVGIALGLCPAVAVSTTLRNGVGMGAATASVLVGSNVLMALVGRALPLKARLPCLVVVVAGLVTIVDRVMMTYMPGLRAGLGIYVPLIAANCIILGRAWTSARGGLAASLADGLGMGLGFGFAICLLSAIREVFGSGRLWDAALLGPNYNPMLILVLAPGGLITLGLVMGLFNLFKQRG
jgi:electron transport complex protein RnfE